MAILVIKCNAGQTILHAPYIPGPRYIGGKFVAHWAAAKGPYQMFNSKADYDKHGILCHYTGSKCMLPKYADAPAEREHVRAHISSGGTWGYLWCYIS